MSTISNFFHLFLYFLHLMIGRLAYCYIFRAPCLLDLSQNRSHSRWNRHSRESDANARLLVPQVAISVELPGGRYAAGEAIVQRQQVPAESGDDRRGDTPPGGRSSVQRRARAGGAAGADQQADGVEGVRQDRDRDVVLRYRCRRHLVLLAVAVAVGDVRRDVREAAATARRGEQLPPVSHATADPAATGCDCGEALVI